MKPLNVHSPRWTISKEKLEQANALVSRTLAQNGIIMNHGGVNNFNVPDMSSLYSQVASYASKSKAEIFENKSQEVNGCKTTTYSCSAGSREYSIYVPPNAITNASGVIMMLHGCTQNPEDFARGTGMNVLAQERGFIVVYPKQARGNNAQSCWNWFSQSDQLRDKGEPKILAGIASDICAKYNVSRENTYVAGLSAGAAMAVILGETYPDIFAGVGAHSGLAYGAASNLSNAFSAMSGNSEISPSPSSRNEKVRTIAFHGMNDATVHPSNSDQIIKQSIMRASPQTLVSEVLGNTDGRAHKVLRSNEMSSQCISEHWQIDGLGHAWSGGSPDGSYTDSKGPNASEEMVRFFFDQNI